MPLAPRTVAGSLDALLAGAESREPMLASDSKSGAHFERVTLGGRKLVVKMMHVDDDWIMRTSGDLTCRPLTMWRSGLLDQLPPCLDHAVIGAATGLGRNGWGAALLMEDVSTCLVPEGDAPVSIGQHLGFLDHMAALHAAFWGLAEDHGLLPVMNRFLEFNPTSMALEGERGWPDAVPPLVIDGWRRFENLAGPLTAPVMSLLDDPTALVEALERCPQTLLHGDWKMGNLGTRPDGRTVLLDWAMPGRSCTTVELAWYLSINSARLPQSKDETISAFRDALGRHGISTDGWWDIAVDLALLGAVVWFGWEKALGGEGPELSWWLRRAEAGLARL